VDTCKDPAPPGGGNELRSSCAWTSHFSGACDGPVDVDVDEPHDSSAMSTLAPQKTPKTFTAR